MTDVFTVAVSLFGPAKTKTWLTQPIPALDGQTPQACIFGVASAESTAMIRECLLRFPG
ncbi:antitoxin Xre/MbcA/ParS toxin-binding domain-containing protein [Blastopirellula marina]|uniref:antitoxin Xre/MbcA/ParS toxin-binding domain-containing protein n=1 Tax=Blastopirellula marina TaxID=124 RepID=UPI0011B04D59|nr:antitoxin Xre/MbcA/ParS toxin-binding domain-containing protein [Blastopirellula marina]